MFKSYVCAPFLCPQPEVCSNHDGMVVNMWCRQCQQPVCGLCAFKDHNGEAHDVVSSKMVVQEKKQHIKDQAVQIRKVISDTETGMSHIVQKFLLSLTDAFKLSCDTHKLSREFTKNTSQVEKSGGIESALLCEARNESLLQLARKLFSLCANHTAASGAVNMPPDGHPETVGPGVNSDTADTEHESGSNLNEESSLKKGRPKDGNSSLARPATSLWPLTICVSNGEGQLAKLLWEDRVLVPTFTSQFIQAHFTIQVRYSFDYSLFFPVDGNFGNRRPRPTV